MFKMAAAGATALLLTASPVTHFAYAQPQAQPAQDQSQSQQAQGQLSDADARALTDARIEIVKDALQLTPSQQQLWQPVEDAIRNRAKNRVTRLYDFAGRAEDMRSHPLQTLMNRNPVELMQRRADALEQRSRDLKQLATAWQPLYQTLSRDQKRRMALLTISVIRQVRNGLQERQSDSYDMDDSD